MKKLRLNMETLAVEAFATGPDAKAALRGTVRANAFTDLCQPPPETLLCTLRSDCTLPPTLGCPRETLDCP